MELFFMYLKQKKKSLLLAAVCSLIFLVCFALYQLPVREVLYPIGLCLVVLLVFLFMDFKKASDKYRKLKMMQNSLEMIAEHLPKAASLEGEAYQQLIRQMSEDEQNLKHTMERKYADMIDYYTVWAHQIKTPIAAMRLNLQNEDSSLARKLSADLFRIEQYVEMVLMVLVRRHFLTYCVFCQELFPVFTVKIPCFHPGKFPSFSGISYASLRMRACSIR